MSFVANILVVLVAVLHLGFLALEMFFWDHPFGRKRFRMTPEYSKASASLAANQGLYNGFLAARFNLGAGHIQYACANFLFDLCPRCRNLWRLDHAADDPLHSSFAGFARAHRCLSREMIKLAARAGILGPALFGSVLITLTILKYDFLLTLGWHPINDPTFDWPSGLAPWRLWLDHDPDLYPQWIHDDHLRFGTTLEPATLTSDSDRNLCLSPRRAGARRLSLHH